MANEKTKNKDKKFKESIRALEHALTFRKKAEEDSFYVSGITKCFETCLEYSWKYFRSRCLEEGIDVYSPKEAIKQAGRLEIIDNVERWLEFLDARNAAVHDYLGVSDQDYFRIAVDFLDLVKKIRLH